MKIYKTTKGIVIEEDSRYYLSKQNDWGRYINRDDLYTHVKTELQTLSADEGIAAWLMQEAEAPVDKQEVWAAGVTYLRSRDARMDESKETGGATFYDKVYEADRPELFFKSTAARVVGPGGKLRIRRDSTWDVPEPELALFITSNAKIVGYSIGNDMSSRSIEGENPLYLPQAKTYDRAAGLGPCLYVSEQPIPSDTIIKIDIVRAGKTMFSDSTPISQMKRSHTELVSFLFRELSFADGCFLMTGTCLVPPNDFTLHSNDEVAISIDHIGTLINTIE